VRGQLSPKARRYGGEDPDPKAKGEQMKTPSPRDEDGVLGPAAAGNQLGMEA